MNAKKVTSKTPDAASNLAALFRSSSAKYLLVKSRKESEEALKAIEDRLGSKKITSWVDHPLDERRICIVNEDLISKCSDIFSNYRVCTREDVREKGFHLSHAFSGPFARELDKLEDMYFLSDGIDSTLGTPNFPALRALILGMLSACYSLRESLQKKARMQELKSKLGPWWATKQRDLYQNGSLVHEFILYMNTEKHGGPLAGKGFTKMELAPRALHQTLIIEKLPQNADIKSMVTSAEGVFVTVDCGKKGERRIPVGSVVAKFDVDINNPPISHLGNSVEGLPLIQLIHMIRDYFAELVFEARTICNDPTLGRFPTPNDGQFMTIQAPAAS